MKEQKTEFITAYGKKRKIGLDASHDGMTKQNFKDECDITKIIDRFSRTGVLEHVRSQAAEYMDAPEIDFQTAQNIVAQGKSMFESLPSKIRNRFENDPGKFLSFMQDEKNHAEARELGLLPPEKVEPAMPTGTDPNPDSKEPDSEEPAPAT